MNIYEVYSNALESSDFDIELYDEDDIGEEALWHGFNGEITGKGAKQLAKAELLEEKAKAGKKGGFLSNWRLKRAENLTAKAGKEAKKANNEEAEAYIAKRKVGLHDRRAGVVSKEEQDWETRGKYEGGMTEKDLKDERKAAVKRTRKEYINRVIHNNPFENNRVQIAGSESRRNTPRTVREERKMNKKKSHNQLFEKVFSPKADRDRRLVEKLDDKEKAYGDLSFKDIKKRNAAQGRIEKRESKGRYSGVQREYV